MPPPGGNLAGAFLCDPDGAGSLFQSSPRERMLVILSLPTIR